MTTTTTADRHAVHAVRDAAVPLTGAPGDFDPLLDLVGDAHYVLLGEASHGTHEFYRVRAAITKRLVADKGFAAVAVEADWPDAYRVNRFVRGAARSDEDATDALDGFKRFPQWMWRNADVLDFVGWLRAYNDRQSRPADKVGFYGATPVARPSVTWPNTATATTTLNETKANRLMAALVTLGLIVTT